MAAHDLADAPPDTIAHHRAAERFLDAEAETALRQLVGAKKNGEVGTRAALPGAVHGIEFSAPHQPRSTREFQAPRLTRE
jgi:acetyl esterase/lipase